MLEEKNLQVPVGRFKISFDCPSNEMKLMKVGEQPFKAE